MNELIVVIDNDNWIYFKTDATDVGSAIDDCLDAAESVGINFDNIDPYKCLLRDRYGETIDVYDRWTENGGK